MASFVADIGDTSNEVLTEASLDFHGPLPDVVVQKHRAVVVRGLDITEHEESDGALSACAGEWVVDCGGWVLAGFVFKTPTRPRGGGDLEMLNIFFFCGV